MMLAIDIGNTNIVLGTFRAKELIHSWRISTDRNKTADELGVLVEQLFRHKTAFVEDIDSVIISSVVPTIMQAMEKMCSEFLGVKPLIVDPFFKTGLTIMFDNPKEVGADRIVNAVAAIEKYGTPVVVVDFGTATTFDVISGQGHYLGGAIAPGVASSMEALFQKASKLPRVELLSPKSVIGKTTVECMQAGIIYGFVGQVDGIVNRIKQELGKGVKVVSTGGLASSITANCQTIDYIDQTLTLDGLRIIFERNQ